MRAVKTRIISTLFSVLVCQVLISNTAGAAVSVGLSDLPLYLAEGVEPNVFLTIDDSGSMAWSYIPTALVNLDKANRGKSSTFNKLYYDPTVTYVPPVDGTGTSLGNSQFTAAWSDGYHQSDTCKVDLSTEYRPTWGSDDYDNCDDEDHYTEVSGWEFAGPPEPAYYYKFDESGAANIDDDAHYTKVKITGDVEKQNFANWYSYYRKRIYTAQAAISLSFSSLEPVFRLSYQTINEHPLTQLAQFSGQTRTEFYNWLIGDIVADHGTPLRKALHNVGSALEDSDDPYRSDPRSPSSRPSSCRQNFHVILTDGEWNKGGTEYGNVDNAQHDIPPNVDGVTSYTPAAPYSDENSSFLADIAFYYWVNDLRSTLANNVPRSINVYVDDNNEETAIDSETYDQTEAVNAKTFWHPENDPATWQHLVNYTISFGVNGDLDYPGDLPGLMSGSTDWSDHHVDDVWHAAINSRGRYLSAMDPQSLIENLSDALGNLFSRTLTAAPVTMNSGSVSSDTRLYQVKFDTEDWSGELVSVPISDGSSNSTCTANHDIGDVCKPEWEASCILDGGKCDLTGTTEVGLNWDTGRTIITYNPKTGKGIPFRWSNLYTDADSSVDQQDLLNGTDNRGAARLNYLRGDKSLEETVYNTCSDCIFRNRKSLLGDLINSAPLYIGEPKRSYPDYLEAGYHSTFQANHRNRTKMIYVGGNDGMLHGFSASTGVEEIAYVPNMVFKKLSSLTDREYSHTSFVDGQLDEGDAFFGSAWHTVLVGGLGYGGQGIFALDVTDPSKFTESSAKNIALWEFSDENDSDIGYTYGKPLIRKLNNGDWAAIFGNGYNNTEEDGHASETGDAAIYIVNVSTGSLIKKISTLTGTQEDPTKAGRPNGIASIQPIDVNSDYKIDFIYAGDLFGNLWRINLEDAEPANWNVAFQYKPLFTAKDDESKAQPITTAPVVGYHKTLVGTMVYFGTGKYIGNNDIGDNSQQTFYAIWDRWFDKDGHTRDNEANLAELSRDHLLEQEILGSNETQFTSIHARVTSNKMIDWDDHKGWYLDLTESGERVYQDPLLRGGRIIFVTVTPGDDACENGGTSWLMELDANSGSRLDISPFDYNRDGAFNGDDMVEIETDGTTTTSAGSGIRIGHGDDFSGIYTIPAVLKMPTPEVERKYLGASGDAVEVVTESSGKAVKQSWREIMECGI